MPNILCKSRLTQVMPVQQQKPIRQDILPGTFTSLCNTYAITKDVVMVARIIGRDCAPVCNTTDRFSPKPNRITAYCNIFLEV